MLGLAEKAAMIVHLLGLVCLAWQKNCNHCELAWFGTLELAEKAAMIVHLFRLVCLVWQKNLHHSLCTCLVWYTWFGRKKLP
jgi:hypothetical protein